MWLYMVHGTRAVENLITSAKIKHNENSYAVK